MMAFPRTRKRFWGRLILLVAFASFSVGALSAQDSDDGGPLQPNTDVSKAAQNSITNDSIIKMTKAGLDEVIILQSIQTQPTRFDLNPDNLIALKQAGVSQPVIAAMQAKSAGVSPRHPLGTLRRNDPSANEEKVIGVVPGNGQTLYENGVYYKDKTGEWVPLKTEKAIQKSGGWVKSTVTYGIIKQDLNGFVYGSHSPLHLAGGLEVLIYAPSGVDAAEYDFIRFRGKSNGREFRATTGGVFHSQSGAERDEIEFTPQKIAPQMYTFTVPSDILKGEYGVLPPGITVNKVYTFAIVE
jgi:hypothetical protein